MDGSDELADFCRREYPRLIGVLSLYCGDGLLAEELAQDALARACRDWKKVARMEHPSAWVVRVGFNLANSYFRRKLAERRAKERLSARGAVAYEDPDGAARVDVRAAVASLPRRHRSALVLHYFLDLPFAEVARVMDAPEPTVKSWAQRGIARLRADAGLADLKEASDVA